MIQITLLLGIVKDRMPIITLLIAMHGQQYQKIEQHQQIKYKLYLDLDLLEIHLRWRTQE